MSGPLLSVEDLVVRFDGRGDSLRRSRSAAVRAVDGVSFEIHRGECLGLVGESGCGKSTLARAIVGLDTPTSGSIRLDGVELTGLSPRAWRPLRRRVQMIFQDPAESMDPRRTIDWTLTEPLRVHGLRKPRERRIHALGLLDAVGLSPAFLNRYPFEFSGGQLQRIGIARALALEPELILCDEPVSALDASVQAQVLNLLAELQERFELTYLFISHDLAVVRHLSNRVAVMYLGRWVEVADRDELYESPAHPYTRSLLASVPKLERTRGDGERRSTLSGEVPSASDPPPGCTFHTRCPEREGVPGDRCMREVPALAGPPTHQSACHL